jgi:hypothetical protein
MARAELTTKNQWPLHLLRSPANAAWLAAGMEEFRDGEGVEQELDRS